MKIRPLYDRIVVKRLEEQEQVQGGIIIPDTAKEKPQEGEVVAVGKGKRNDKGEFSALELEVGNKILFEFSAVLTCITSPQLPTETLIHT